MHGFWNSQFDYCGDDVITNYNPSDEQFRDKKHIVYKNKSLTGLPDNLWVLADSVWGLMGGVCKGLQN